jgi:hypothetical protein
LSGDGRESFGEVGDVFVAEINIEIFGIEFDAHEEQAGFLIGVFVGVQDVAAVAIDEVRDGGDFAFRVGAGDEENGGEDCSRHAWLFLLIALLAGMIGLGLD